MVNRILGFIGWLGTALVIASVLVRFGLPAKEQYVPYLAWAGLVCLLAYSAGQWREIIALFARRQTRYGTLSTLSVLVVLGILAAVNYIGVKQAKRWDLTTNKVYSLSDQSRKVLATLDAPLQIVVFAQDNDFQRFKDRLEEYPVRLQERDHGVPRSGQEAGAGTPVRGAAIRHDSPGLQGTHRAHHV